MADTNDEAQRDFESEIGDRIEEIYAAWNVARIPSDQLTFLALVFIAGWLGPDVTDLDEAVALFIRRWRAGERKRMERAVQSVVKKVEKVQRAAQDAALEDVLIRADLPKN